MQFQNGTILHCDLEVHQREDETGEAEIFGYVVGSVHGVQTPPPANEATHQQFVLPLDSSQGEA